MSAPARWAVIGPNGARKSSLINGISGLCRTDQGQSALGGHSFAHVPPGRLPGPRVARTFQNLARFPGLTIAENIACGLVFRHRAFARPPSCPPPGARRAEPMQGCARSPTFPALARICRALSRPSLSAATTGGLARPDRGSTPSLAG
ncbi:ATP-binding cassette domain-containing protein [Pseudogemmobacter bohemicus]|uniref:ATP-binding cassette domain-containing protein n=1 Tax=Pseudogemmobacter bohemicus TaxID=2250708 RepID=UPI0018E57FBB